MTFLDILIEKAKHHRVCNFFKLWSFGLWLCMVWLVAADAPEEPPASIFRIYMSQAGKWRGYTATVEGMVNQSHWWWSWNGILGRLIGMVEDDPEKGNYITGLMRTMGRGKQSHDLSLERDFFCPFRMWTRDFHKLLMKKLSSLFTFLGLSSISIISLMI